MAKLGKIVKYIVGGFAFMTGLWTFHWNIDATLEKHEHDVLSETFQRLERRLTAKETDVSSRPLFSLVTALQGHEEARWGVRIHKLLAHDFIFSKWFFHPPGVKLLRWAKLEPGDELKRLEAYEQYRAFARKQAFDGSKASLLSPKKAAKASDAAIFLMIDTVVGAGIYFGDYRDGRHAAEELMKEARRIGSSANVVKALEAFRVQISAENRIQ